MDPAAATFPTFLSCLLYAVYFFGGRNRMDEKLQPNQPQHLKLPTGQKMHNTNTICEIREKKSAIEFLINPHVPDRFTPSPAC